MDKATSEEREAAIAQWREAGEHFKLATERLVGAVRAGWRRNAADMPPGLHDELQAFTRRLEQAAHDLRREAQQSDVQRELDEGREAVSRAAARTEEVIRKDIKYVADAFADAEHT